MPQKNWTVSFPPDLNQLPALLYRARFAIVIAFSLMLLLLSCKKSSSDPAQPVSLVQQYFEDNILNHDFQVQLATDTGVNITSQFTGYIFRLTKGSGLSGPMTGSNSLIAFYGTWSSNSDYSKLTISLPALPSCFIFLNREWKFTKKTLPIMELAPWGTTDPKVLHMERL
jgi:hypothetical protein